MNTRIGQGFDIHRYVQHRPLILAGIHIPHTQGLEGDSDADCLCHAIIDALLGALHLGNLGSRFPSGAQHSYLVLADFFKSLYEQGVRLVNLDSTVIAQQPKLSPWIPEMESRIAEALYTPVDTVSIKPKTHDHLDALGQEKAVAAHVLLLLTTPGPLSL